jgi:hypothetical protein
VRLHAVALRDTQSEWDVCTREAEIGGLPSPHPSALCTMTMRVQNGPHTALHCTCVSFQHRFLELP